MPALPPHTMGYQKSEFMQPQQQRMEVTVPVPEARVSFLRAPHRQLSCCFVPYHLYTASPCRLMVLQLLQSCSVPGTSFAVKFLHVPKRR